MKSEFSVLEKGEKVRSEYGREDFVLKKSDIEALLQGKRLFARVCFEYDITISLEKTKGEPMRKEETE